ncbi:predicted protein [Plenodomus lingam JN3]|uniref:Predicted protein n=1 Tax=Leptosphaeria maculans (strain JN3 / isolate v23.1.3 / race Av1-4-5-6-7-8) TaxID=985895 RepID=E5AD30_LEPMJ|nr:predicted protein [Plenodomus lingam JN3]CBY02382.1 predicted protein [Plenodomus lingam JN3]
MAVPLLFTLPPSNRHDFLALDPSDKYTLKSLNKLITATIASSPNCEECMVSFLFSTPSTLPLPPSTPQVPPPLPSPLPSTLPLPHPSLTHPPPTVMASHKPPTSTPETIQQLRMHWDTKKLPAKMWPEYTVLTEENVNVILQIVGREFGIGVLEVGLGKGEEGGGGLG